MATTGRGFAGMDRKKLKELSSKGGKAAHEKGVAYEWTKKTAAEAGRKGGLAGGSRKVRRRKNGEVEIEAPAEPEVIRAAEPTGTRS